MKFCAQLAFYAIGLVAGVTTGFTSEPTRANNPNLRDVITWISSPADQPWQRMPAPLSGPGSPNATPEVTVTPGKTYQTIDGFGGCFNELGWVALGKASGSDRSQVLAALFGENGCGFTLARVPTGASVSLSTAILSTTHRAT